MGKLLLEIQVRKSTADGKGAAGKWLTAGTDRRRKVLTLDLFDCLEDFYKELTEPSAHWIEELRPLVLAKKQPRKIFVQPNTVIEGGEVVLKEYPVTCEGVIESFIERGL